MLSGVILKVKHSTGPQRNGCSDTRPPDACIQGRSWHQSISLKFLLYFSLKRSSWKQVLAFSLGGPMSHGGHSLQCAWHAVPIWARYAAGYNHARTLSFPTSAPSWKLPCLPKRLSPSLSSWKIPIHPSRSKVWSTLWQTFHLLFAPDPPPPPPLPSRVRVPCPVYVTGAFQFQCLPHHDAVWYHREVPGLPCLCAPWTNDCFVHWTNIHWALLYTLNPRI